MKSDMFENQLKQVVEMELKARQAREQLEVTRIAELKALPGRYGYKVLEDFIKALKEAAGKRGPKAPKAAAGKRKGKGSRARISPETKEQIIADLKAGAKTAKAIAEEYGISYPSVMIIKRKAGLIGGEAPAAS